MPGQIVWAVKMPGQIVWAVKMLIEG